VIRSPCRPPLWSPPLAHAESSCLSSLLKIQKEDLMQVRKLALGKGGEKRCNGGEGREISDPCVRAQVRGDHICTT
jgi:hypothetical protein